MIIDSHTHVWVHEPEKYPWAPVGGYIPETEAPIEGLIDTLASSHVEGAVLVQPTPYGWDNSYLLDAAKKDPDKFRCVCLVDPMSSQNSDEMIKLVKLHGVKGFRINWHLNSVSEWQNNHEHLIFWQTASELNTPLCIQCTLEYMPLLKDMCGRFSQVRVVVDHLARFNTSIGTADSKFSQLLELSAHPNVFIKISGLNYCSRQLAPYVDTLPFIQAILYSYGVQRCLWGSDFPFIKEHWSYTDFLEFIRENFLLTEEDQQWLLGKTAKSLWW